MEKIIIIISIISVLLIVSAVIVYRIISKYNDTEKWAAVTISGTRESETFAFYEKAGYNSSDKTAFIQWLGREI